MLLVSAFHARGRNHGFQANEGFRPFCTHNGKDTSAPLSTDHNHQVISRDFNHLLFLPNFGSSNQYLGCATLLVIYNLLFPFLFFLCLQQLPVPHHVRFLLSFDRLHHIVPQQVFSLKFILVGRLYEFLESNGLWMPCYVRARRITTRP
ncbi:hypothetical protein NA56DRAFT_341810 [Hyaloscypha hepaticicola]|uniref:Uncharacterized protein n=1 Tax=Hyaloscypha hepaticicola TaxID=2082293 RepID=A0A2J6QJ71_9HELO|nr:hypothetical protein NA56DRAFT_341810 [Hyaloscypha hepaticicola]